MYRQPYKNGSLGIDPLLITSNGFRTFMVWSWENGRSGSWVFEQMRYKP